MEDNYVLAYLDHNVLDLMTKDDPDKIKELLSGYNFTPVYSDETLREIHRSIGYEHTFLDLLDEIKATYIEPILDHNFRQTGRARLHFSPSKTHYESFLERQLECASGDFGISEMLMKFYGGRERNSFKEIFQQGAVDLQKYLEDTLNGIEDMSLSEIIDMQDIKKLIENLPDIMMHQSSKIAAELDKREISPVSEFEQATGLGPKVLNNVEPPNVVEKIWQMLSDAQGFPGDDMEMFFGVKPRGFETDANRERTTQEKVNAIYHQLNFLGYYRDSKMQKEKRFRASFSDMTHAGVASFCHLFLCRDEDLVMKAAAAYEYLGVQTKILHYKADKVCRSTVGVSGD